MNNRIEKIVDLAKSYNTSRLETTSTDVENTLKMEQNLELSEIYQGVDKKSIREDIIYLVDFLQKIERSHGGNSRGKDVIVETIAYLEKNLRTL